MMKALRYLTIAILFMGQGLSPSEASFKMEFRDPAVSDVFKGHRQFFLYPEKDYYATHMGVSQIYKNQGIEYPMIPLVHPYHPLDDERIDAGILRAPLTVQIPTKAFQGLPESIKNEIIEKGVDLKDSLKIFISSQNYPWEEGTVTCFRPQYTTDGPWAPSNGKYWAIRDIKTGLFLSDTTKVCFKDHKPNEFIEDSISTHPEGSSRPDDGISGQITLSGDNLHIEGLTPGVGQSFWSYVGYHDGFKYRAVVTLHWMLNDKQQNSLLKILGQYPAGTHKKPYDLSFGSFSQLFDRIGNDPAFKDKGGHVLKSKELLKFLDPISNLRSENFWGEDSLEERLNKIETLQRFFTQCGIDLGTLSYEMIKDYAQAARKDLSSVDYTFETALKLKALIDGLKKPGKFIYPNNNHGIKDIIAAEQAVLAGERQAVMSFINYALKKGISIEEVIRQAKDYRREKFSSILEDHYEEEDERPLITEIPLSEALACKEAEEDRSQLLQEGDTKVQKKREDLIKKITDKSYEINWTEDDDLVEQIDLKNDDTCSTRKILNLDGEVEGNPLHLNIIILTFLNPLWNLCEDTELANMPKVSENDLKAVLGPYNRYLKGPDSPKKKGEFEDLLKVTQDGNGALVQKLISRPEFRKRVKRLHQKLPALYVERGVVTTEEEAKRLFAEELCSSFSGRCASGVFDGLSKLERKHLKGAVANNKYLLPYVKVAEVLWKHLNDHIDKHGSPLKGDDERRTTACHTIRQRIKSVFPVGDLEYVASPPCGEPWAAHNQPAAVIKKWIKGGQIDFEREVTLEILDEDGTRRVNRQRQTVTFDPLTVKKLADLVYEAFEEDELVDYVRNQPLLRVLSNKIIEDLQPCEFFDLTQKGKGFYKKTVVLHLLAEIGLVNFGNGVNVKSLYKGGKHDNRTLTELLDRY